MSGWIRDKLLKKVPEVTVWKKGGQRAPHKPLLIPYALGKLLEDQNEIRFKDYYESFENLLRGFGPPRKVYHPEFPFWYLRTEEFWEIKPATGLVMKKGDLSAASRSFGSANRNQIFATFPRSQPERITTLYAPSAAV